MNRVRRTTSSWSAFAAFLALLVGACQAVVLPTTPLSTSSGSPSPSASAAASVEPPPSEALPSATEPASSPAASQAGPSSSPSQAPTLFGDVSVYYHSSGPGDAEEQYTLNLHVDVRFEKGKWVTVGGSWDIAGSGTGAGVDCLPPRTEHGTFGGHGTWLAPGQAATGALGEGTLGFGIVNSAPEIAVYLTTPETWTDACTLTSGTHYLLLTWGGGLPSCNLDQIGGVPCEEHGSGPANVAPDDTGPYDLSGSVILTEHPLSGTVTTSYRVVGVIGGTPSQTP